MTDNQYAKELRDWRGLFLTIAVDDYADLSWSAMYRVLGKRANLSTSTVRKLLEGTTRFPQHRTICKLSSAIGLPQLSNFMSDWHDEVKSKRGTVLRSGRLRAA